MGNDLKSAFLDELTIRCGKVSKFSGSRSLYKVEGSNIRLYVRYSKTHSGGRTWYGLREIDLQQLEGYPSLLCFLWDGQTEPLIVPYSEYEDVFQSTTPADDGQYKVQIILENDGTELYIARAGRFNVEGYFGWDQLETLVDSSTLNQIPDLSHSQIQTLLGSIGMTKNYDVWIPPDDRTRLDWALARQFACREFFPYGFGDVESILHEIDVIWIQRGSNELRAFFEVEHSTPVYSGLLRFNDIHLVAPNLRSRFSVVANAERRSLFVRQINRPTFRMSGLSELCTFLEYDDVFNWHQRIARRDINV
ncbi:MAG TPA: hypothetical protein VI755_00980 [Anaerolineales bacterium]|nr:hypothetical protein [Anaerolineales bacterium]